MDLSYDVVAPAHAYPSSETREFPIVPQDSRAIVTSEAGSEDNALVHSFKEFDYVNTDMVLTSAGPDQDIPVDFLPQETWIDVDRPIDSFGPEDIKDLKLAADFLFASQCREDSFTLYVLLLQKLKGSPNSHEWMTISTIIACARSSTTPSQAEIARNLLEQRLSDLSANAQDVAETFLYRSLLAEICCRQGDDDARQFHHHLAKHSNFARERSLKILPRDSRALDLVTYHYLRQALKCEGHFIACRSVTEQLLCQVPGPFELIEGRMRESCIRSCLQWCIDQWVGNLFMCGSWQNLKSRGENMRRLEALGTFSELWQRWQRQQPEDTSQMQSRIWAYQVEHSMGISPSEILAVTCVMMLNVFPAKAVFDLNPLQDAANIPRRALRGGRILSKNSDSELAHSFLGAYLWLNSSSDENPADANHAVMVRGYTRAFLQDGMRLQLPEVQHSQEIELSQAITEFEAKRRHVNPSVSSILPTIASSLQSSDFNSLRLFKERIQEQVDNVTQSSCVQLPSRAMRDASRSSLSLLSVVMKDASRSSLSVELPKRNY